MAKLVKRGIWLALTCALVAIAAYVLILPNLGQSARAVTFDGLAGNVERGAYIATAAGCYACHTDHNKNGKLLAGGPAIKTPFGTFYGPNITPDPAYGIGGWTLDQFARALTAGLSPSGRHYFQSFPYTSYVGMKPQDIVDLKMYLDTVPPIASLSKPHELSWPFSDRAFVGVWKARYFASARLGNSTRQSNRGAYLVNVLGHCGACHTQRDWLGGLTGRPLAGNFGGSDAANVPGIRKPTTDGSPWSGEQVVMSLQLGMKPNGDFLEGTMSEVVAHSTSKLRAEDRAAIAKYLIGLD